MVPFSAGPPHDGVERVAQDDVDRHAVAPGVVDRHGGVLQSDRAVGKDAERLALDLGVSVRHSHRRLLVAVGDELGALVAAVIDHRFVEAAEARPRVGANVFEAQGLDNVHHEIRAGPPLGERVDFRRPVGLGRRHHGYGTGRLCRLGVRRLARRHQRRGADDGSVSQEVATVNGRLLQFLPHNFNPQPDCFDPQGLSPRPTRSQSITAAAKQADESPLAPAVSRDYDCSGCGIPAQSKN